MDQNPLETSANWLTALSVGEVGGEFENLTVTGVQVVEVREGFIRCHFVVPSRLADKDGNWQVGAMATLIDDVGAAAICSLVGHIKLSVDFNISFYSAAKIQEEVEMIAEVVGEMGKLASVKVEVRRKLNGQLIALAKQWMTSFSSHRVGTSKL